MCKITVLVTTYNQPLEGVLATLGSAIRQDFDDFEIVVADDCSQITHEQEIKDYFAAHSFNRYKLVMNPENYGTVLNMVEGLKVAEGEFVKGVGAGDLLFSPDTLAKIYDFAKRENLNLGFGRIMTYSPEGDSFTVSRFDAPSDPSSYRKGIDSEKLAEHQLLDSDWIPGGSLFFRREYLLAFLQRLSAEYGVRYCEDLVSPLVAMEEQILFLDEYVLWYEWGVGVSNDGSSRARTRMYTDHGNYFDALARNYPNNAAIRKARRRFQVKRFLALKTPLYSLARILGAAHYLSKDTDDDAKGALEFLKECRAQ